MTAFMKSLCKIAIPVTLQSMLQASFSIIDQIMIGQLGETEISAVGLCGNYTMIFSVVIGAVGAVAGIMIAQFIGLGLGAAARTLGKKNKKRVVKIVIGVVFAVVSLVPYLLLFHNPLYPMTARHRLKSFADKTITDYPIADKKVYYSLNDSRYMCRVIMSDGQVRVLYLDESGEAKRQ